MAHLTRVVRVKQLHVKAKLFHRAKIIALDLYRQKEPKVSCQDKFVYWKEKYLHCGWLKTFVRDHLSNEVIMSLLVAYKRIITPGTFFNHITGAILGFMGGLFLTYMYFLLAVGLFKFPVPLVFWISTFFCVFLTLGLAFSKIIRDVVLSSLPQLCMSEGRGLLVGYAVLLAVTGPGSNIMYNTKQLTGAVVCTNDQFEAVSKNLTELYKRPLRTLRVEIVNLMKNMKPYIEKLKNGLIIIRDALAFIGMTLHVPASAVDKAFSWLHLMNVLCRSKLGSPFELCLKQIPIMEDVCEATFHSSLHFLCNGIEPIIYPACTPMKLLDLACEKLSWIKKEGSKFLASKIKSLGQSIKTMFYVSVDFHHSFDFTTNKTRSLKEVITEVFRAQEERFKFHMTFLDMMSLSLGIYIAYALFRGFLYRYRFMNHKLYDNKYINEHFVELDMKRFSFYGQSIFPLTFREKLLYVTLFSLQLTTSERKRLFKGAIFLGYACTKLAYLLALDTLLAWILDVVNRFGKVQYDLGRSNRIISAEGSGFWYTMYAFIEQMLNPLNLEFHFDTAPCLPVPNPVNIPQYKKIGITLLCAWMFLAFQPFIFRFRNYLMATCNPQTGRIRAIWLYNLIVQRRGSFSNFIRKHGPRRDFPEIYSKTPKIIAWLRVRFPILRLCWPSLGCNVCEYYNPKVICTTLDCPGMYCTDCFEWLGNKCYECNMTAFFKGLNISEEEDSDDDDDDESVVVTKKSFPVSPTNEHRDTPSRTVEETPLPITVKGTHSNAKRDSEPTDAPKDYFSDVRSTPEWAVIKDYLLPLPELSK